MRLENQLMTNFLAANGIKARVKYIWKGSLKRSWRMYNLDMPWNDELRQLLTDLGFTSVHGGPLTQFEGNGGRFSCIRSRPFRDSRSITDNAGERVIQRLKHISFWISPFVFAVVIWIVIGYLIYRFITW